MRLSGSAFPPRSSERREAKVDLSQQGFIDLHVAEDIFTCSIQDIEISESVGNVPTRLKLKNGWVIVLEPSTELSSWLKSHKKVGWLNWFEGNAFAWLVSLVFCVAFGAWTYVYALPWTSEKVAIALPDEVSLVLGDKVLETLDESFEPTAISEERQEKIRQRVSQHLLQLEPLPFKLKVEFRQSEHGANAFALPGGTIILLDDLVEMAETPEQLDSIIFHEIGHVYHRHMMTKLVHSSLLSVMVAVITGESSGVIDNLASIGVFVVANGQSRDAEREADAYAKHAMLKVYGTSEPMAQMFEKLHQASGSSIPAWLSTHPDLEQRIKDAK